ncbi:MAG: NAD/NADP octopine/nopaline dehydrogenase family protein, partial [Psychromonas sp.]
LGVGAGGSAIAFDYASHGHSVRLFDFPEFPGNIEAIANQGGVYAEGDISGFGPVDYAGHDIDKALQDAELIYVVGPAFSTVAFGKACVGKLKPGQVVIISPGSCAGALVFKQAAGLAFDDDSVRIAETHTLQYAVRLLEAGRVHVFLKLKAGNLLAALPGRHTEDILQIIADVYPGMEAAHNVIQTSLQNANPVIHPAVSLTNAARIEGEGDFLFYEEGVSDSVGRVIGAVDHERIAIGNRLGITILSDPEIGIRQGYMQENNYGSAYRNAPGFQGIPAQPQLDHRYINEDVGYGLVFMSGLAKQIGIETPTIDAIIQMSSVLMDRDYVAEALRTPESLGISGLTVEQLSNL